MSLSRDDLVGVWTLQATYTEDDDGNRTPVLGENPQGRIMYTADGYMTLFEELLQEKQQS